MIEAIVTILAGAAGGVSAKVAEQALKSDESATISDTEQIDSQAIEVIKHVGENASSPEQIATTLHGFSIHYSDNGDKKEKEFKMG